MEINEKISAIVTGGASGLGEATARMLSSVGANVAIFDLDENKGLAVSEKINSDFYKVDVTELLHGLASITLRGDQIISGVAINFLAAGLTVVIAQDLFGQGGRTPPLKSGGRFEPINFPGATSSKEINDAGPLLQLCCCRRDRCRRFANSC